MAILRPGAIRNPGLVPPPGDVRPTGQPIRPVTGPMVGGGAIVPPRFANAGRRFNRGGMTRGNRF